MLGFVGSLIIVFGAIIYSWIRVFATTTSTNYSIKRISLVLIAVLTVNLYLFKGCAEINPGHFNGFVLFQTIGWAGVSIAFPLSGGLNVLVGRKNSIKIFFLILLPLVQLLLVWATWHIGVSLGFFTMFNRS